MVMYQTRTNEWIEICLQAMWELEPDRRMAILEKLGRFLRTDKHEFGPLLVDFGNAEVKRNGNPVYLTNLEFRLLRYLVERAGNLVSRDELLRSVWGYNNPAFTRTVDVHVHGLRQKLEPDVKRPELIITVKGMGYKFVAARAEN
jgi:DNA-binding response OmpR family regulator